MPHNTSPSPRNSNQSRGTDARALRGTKARTRDQLKSDRDNTQSTKPAARRDQFGSQHNEDEIKTHQRQLGRPKRQSNLDFRESAQDLQPDRGARNKVPGRRSPKSGGRRNSGGS